MDDLEGFDEIRFLCPRCSQLKEGWDAWAKPKDDDDDDDDI
jgi:hypothetical protein